MQVFKHKHAEKAITKLIEKHFKRQNVMANVYRIEK
jgi:hypothetical protein